MSRLRSAQENVQAHRVDELEEIPARSRKAGGETVQDDKVGTILHSSPWLQRYSQVCMEVMRNG